MEDILDIMAANEGYSDKELDDALALKANSADVMLTSAINTALGLKADIADYMTTSAINSALALKQNLLASGGGSVGAVILSGTVIKRLAITYPGLTLSETSNAITLATSGVPPYVSTALGLKQDALTNGSGSGEVLLNGSTVKRILMGANLSSSSTSERVQYPLTPKFRTSIPSAETISSSEREMV